MGDNGSADHVVVSLFIDAEDGGGGVTEGDDQMEDVFGCEGRDGRFQVYLVCKELFDSKS